MFGIFKNLLASTDNNQLTEAIAQGAFLVDVRTPAEFSGGSVPGATNIPLDQINQHIAQFKNKKSVIVFCKSGGRSSQAKSILDSKGITNVINGGTWQNVNKAKNN